MWASQLVVIVKNLPATAGDVKRRGFDPWVWKIPWRRKWQLTPVFLPGESHGQRSLASYSPQTGLQRVGHDRIDLARTQVTVWALFPSRLLGLRLFHLSKHKSMTAVQGAWYISQAGWLRVFFFFFLPRKRNTDMVYSADLGKLVTSGEGGIRGRFRKWTSLWQLMERHSRNSWNVPANAPSLKNSDCLTGNGYK